MELPFYQVDAFVLGPFSGNPAAVCLVEDWPDDALLQAVAAENNLSETAFLRRGPDPRGLRWFTPTVEVKLCGHATLASAHVLFSELSGAGTEAGFETRSGTLTVSPAGGDRYRMDFPAAELEPLDRNQALARAAAAALGLEPEAFWRAGEDLLCRLEDAATVLAVAPDLAALGRLEPRGVIVTAAGGGADYCSRFFGPAVGVPEDPVTGSAHCALAPYWSGVLGRSRLTARQLSARGGELVTELRGDRVRLEGRCRTVIRGRFQLPAG